MGPAGLGAWLGGLVMLGAGACSSTPASGSEGGAGGAGGTVPLPAVCRGGVPGDTVQLSLLGPDGMPVEAPVTTAVTVASVDSCATATCPSTVTAAASRIVLANASQQQWTLYLRNAAMPENLIAVGGAFDLSVATAVDTTFYRTVDQTVVLARGGDLIVFAASLQQFYRLSLPMLTSFGIVLGDEGMLCETGTTAGCHVRPHAARATVGDATAVVAGGETQSIGWLSFSNGLFTVLGDTGGCDAKSKTLLAGFRL